MQDFAALDILKTDAMLCENTNYFTQPVNRIDKDVTKCGLRGTVFDIPVWDFQQDDVLERF